MPGRVYIFWYGVLCGDDGTWFKYGELWGLGEETQYGRSTAAMVPDHGEVSEGAEVLFVCVSKCFLR